MYERETFAATLTRCLRNPGYQHWLDQLGGSDAARNLVGIGYRGARCIDNRNPLPHMAEATMVRRERGERDGSN